MTGADLRLNSPFKIEALGPRNARRNGITRSGFSFCFSGKYPNAGRENRHGGRDGFLRGGQVRGARLKFGN